MLGVLGGMGPAAGAYFAYRLALLTSARCDQEHLPVLLLNDPRVPDRSEAVLGRGENPLPAMLQGLRLLAASGCRCAAVPCNTAHYWHRELQANVDMPILHIVSSAIDDLPRRGVRRGRIGVLGTRATVTSSLYAAPLSAAGYTVLPFTEDDIEQLCVRPIEAVKQNRITDAAGALANSVRVLYDRGADAVILACTELPVARAALRGARLDLPVVDSVDSLATSALRHFGYSLQRGEP